MESADGRYCIQTVTILEYAPMASSEPAWRLVLSTSDGLTRNYPLVTLLLESCCTSEVKSLVFIVLLISRSTIGPRPASDSSSNFPSAL